MPPAHTPDDLGGGVWARPYVWAGRERGVVLTHPVESCGICEASGWPEGRGRCGGPLLWDETPLAEDRMLAVLTLTEREPLTVEGEVACHCGQLRGRIAGGRWVPA